MYTLSNSEHSNLVTELTTAADGLKDLEAHAPLTPQEVADRTAASINAQIEFLNSLEKQPD